MKLRSPDVLVQLLGTKGLVSFDPNLSSQFGLYTSKGDAM